MKVLATFLIISLLAVPIGPVTAYQLAENEGIDLVFVLDGSLNYATKSPFRKAL